MYIYICLYGVYIYMIIYVYKMYLSDFRIFVSGPTCPPRTGAVHWLGGRAFSSGFKKSDQQSKDLICRHVNLVNE